MTLVRRYAWRALPLAMLVALYWPGLTNWFYQDDFGWLNLRRDVHSAADLGPALFAPRAHGNMRPLGENAYFLAISSLFGVEALPFRLWAFLTQMASLLLLGSVVRRLTGSEAAGFWAQALWIANCGMGDLMSWTSIYNQVLSGFFFLLAFYFFLRGLESGERRDRVGEWAAFALGLGALEINVMYPAVAAAYLLLFRRSMVKRVLPMFAVSAVWMLVHFRFAPVSHDGPYALHIDGRLFATLWTYWKLALGPPRLAVVRAPPGWLAPAAIAVMTAAAVGLAVCRALRRDYLGVFALAWFAIVLAPYLPLSDHIMGYYVAVPSIGPAMLGAWAIAGAWRRGMASKAAAVAAVALYLGVSVPAARAITEWHHDRGIRVRELALGVAEIHAANPGKAILIDGVDTDLFWSGIVDLPFRVMEIPHVYLTPGSEARIQAPAGLAGKFVLPREPALRALAENRAVVYETSGAGLRNITRRWAAAEAGGPTETPRFINLGDSLFDPYLGAGWEPSRDGYRYMDRTGAVRMGGARTAGERLYIGVFETRDFRLRLRVNGVDIPAPRARRDFDLSEFVAALPAAAIGQKDLEIHLSGDTGWPLKFGYLEIR